MSVCFSSPQYMANFRWHLDPVTKLPVNVTVRANNKLILSIIGLQPLGSAAATASSESTAETTAAATVIPSHTTLQWPIYPPGTARPANDKAMFINQTIDTGSGAVGLLNANRVFIDALAFTGNAAVRGLFGPGTVILSAPEGSTATVMQGGTLTCP
jgi:hypothetical protein